MLSLKLLEISFVSNSKNASNSLLENPKFFPTAERPKVTRIPSRFFCNDAFSHANASRVAGEERKRGKMARSPRESGSLLREEGREREREILHGLIDSGVPWPVVLMRCDSRTWKSCRQLAGLFPPPPPCSASKGGPPPALDTIPYAHTCHATVHRLLKRF